MLCSLKDEAVKVKPYLTLPPVFSYGKFLSGLKPILATSGRSKMSKQKKGFSRHEMSHMKAGFKYQSVVG
jgi:hypothetical protein